MIVVQCECGKTLQVPEDTPAAKGICPNCRRVLLLPKGDSKPRLRATLAGHHGAIRDAAFSPDGRLLATVSAFEETTGGKPKPGETRIWDCAKGALTSSLQGHTGAVFAVAFDLHDEKLVTGGKDHTVAVWELTRGLHGVVTGVKHRTLTGHEHSVSSLVFSPASRLLASASSHQIMLWDTTSWRLQQTLIAPRLGVCRLAFSPDGGLLAGVWASRGPVVVWDMKTRKPAFQLKVLPEEDADDYGVSFSPDGSQLAVASHSGIRIWDVSSCQVLLAIERTGIRAVGYSRDGLTVFSAGNDLPEHVYVRCWDASSGRRMEEFRGHKRPASCLALSVNGRLLASGSEDQTVNLWELPAAGGAAK